MPKPRTRTKCPTCARMCGKLLRRDGGRFPAYGRPDGTVFYSCPWGGCRRDFAVRADGVVCDINLQPIQVNA